MFSLIDNFMIARATRLMQWLNREQGLTAPIILREALMAFIVSYGAFGLVVMASGDFFASVAVVLFGSILYPSLWSVLTKYAADSDKEWTTSLAMRYMAQAIGKQESMRIGRFLGWVSVMLYPALLFITGSKPQYFYTFIYIAAMGSGLAYEYLAAAEPTAPGERRRQASMDLAHANNR